jgi:hypothetical protein
VLRNPHFQFSPGLGYGKRGEVLDAHLMEAEHIFTSEGQAIHSSDKDRVLVFLGYLNSPVYQYLINLYCGQHKHAGYINLLPCAPLDDLSESTLAQHIEEIIRLKRKWLAYDETTIGYNYFLLSRLSRGLSIETEFAAVKTEYALDRVRLEHLKKTVSDIIVEAAGMDVMERKKLTEWAERTLPTDPLWPGLQKEDQVELTDGFLASSLASEVVGILFGRWAADRIGQACLYEESVRTRGPAFYPSVFRGGLAVAGSGQVSSWGPKGIFVDDGSDLSDLETSFGRVLQDLYGESASTIEQGISVRLNAQTLRDYFSVPAGFFADHLERYTKSRREAPIYWPLSTASGGYTLWVYYPTLSSQILYAAINDFVEPKLKQVSELAGHLRNKGSGRSRGEEKQFEELQVFERELMDLRDALLKIAPTYKPNQDDGVQITAAPLWPLFRHKPWQKVLKDTWAKLEKGDYDWAHLAMNYWPDRVREKCKTDKSLAIAHGLEEPYVAPASASNKTGGRKGRTG